MLEIIKGIILGVVVFIILALIQILLFPHADQSYLLLYYSGVIVLATILFLLRLLSR